jgi:3-oxoacyl-[acyl-carrier protein] reductase
MFDLTGKTALVTGATGGIGGAIAKALHGQGAHVVLSGTRESALSDLAAQFGERVSFVAANLSDAAAVDGLVAKAEEAAGAPLDIVIANAGITRDGLIVRMKDEDWDTVIKVNLEGYFRLSRAAAKGMMKRRSGRIIGITSIVGVTGNPGQTNYAASKAGMIGFSKALAQELGQPQRHRQLRGSGLHRQPDDRRPERAAAGRHPVDHSRRPSGRRERYRRGVRLPGQ